MIKHLLLFHIFVSLPISFATEVDSFTNRHYALRDSTYRVNQITNELLMNAVRSANDGGHICDETLLYNEIDNKMGGFLWADLENRILNDTTIEKRSFKREQSIYGNLSFFQFLPHYLVKMGSLINIKGNVIGVDKIGHFIGIGYHYFKIAYLDGLGVEAALKYGEAHERGFFGLSTTGVYSYGDLAANYKGMKFWVSILNDENLNPYVKCDGEKWVMNRDFKWEEYVDASFDEGINCNKYRDEQFEKSLAVKLNFRENKGRATQCPIRKSDCAGLRVKYGIVANRIINPDC